MIFLHLHAERLEKDGERGRYDAREAPENDLSRAVSNNANRAA
jgi:hypothetical protein